MKRLNLLSALDVEIELSFKTVRKSAPIYTKKKDIQETKSFIRLCTDLFGHE